MTKESQPYSDEEQRAFIESRPLNLTFSDVHSACQFKFGKERAWSLEKIKAFWHTRIPARKHFRISRDLEVQEFIDDRIGRLTIDQIKKDCLAKFGRSRCPSRTSIGDYWQITRAARRRGRNPL